MIPCPCEIEVLHRHEKVVLDPPLQQDRSHRLKKDVSSLLQVLDAHGVNIFPNPLSSISVNVAPATPFLNVPCPI